jgi:hypothetical protein
VSDMCSRWKRNAYTCYPLTGSSTSANGCHGIPAAHNGLGCGMVRAAGAMLRLVCATIDWTGALQCGGLSQQAAVCSASLGVLEWLEQRHALPAPPVGCWRGWSSTRTTGAL